MAILTIGQFSAICRMFPNTLLTVLNYRDTMMNEYRYLIYLYGMRCLEI